jgi:hypothetical protein
MKIRILVSLCSLCLALSGNLYGQTQPAPGVDDRAAIRRAALDYIEGWYSGDATRMEQALHPELAKRMVATDPKTGRSSLDQMGAMTLVQNTRKGYGTHFPKEQQTEDVTIFDVEDNAASVKIDAATWIDYLQLAKWNGEWKIVNVLWAKKPALQSPQQSGK